MEDPTPQEKMEEALTDKLHSWIINDEGCRNTFINKMIDPDDITDDDWDSIHKFIDAIDYMLGTLGYAVCDMHAKGGPMPIDDPNYPELLDS